MITESNRRIFRQDTGDSDGSQWTGAVLTDVVVEIESSCLPKLVRVPEDVLLDRRHPDAHASIDRSLEPFDLIAVMVGDQDVGEVVDAERGQLFEGRPAAEIDGDASPTGAQNVHVARIRNSEDVFGDPRPRSAVRLRHETPPALRANRPRDQWATG